MDQQSQIKVIKAGFQIIRCDDQPQPRIKIKGDYSHAWTTFDKFNTKAARNEKFKELMLKPKIISD